MIAHVLLTGYYGFGNLGDDLLCVCTVRIARRLFPSSKISLFTWSQDASYLKDLINEPVEIFTKTMPSADVILHGGGGVFFDFKNGSPLMQTINAVIRTIGPYRYQRVVSWYQQNIKGRQRTPLRIGLGLGVGKYTRSSKRFYSDILSMADFSYLMVRDEESAENLSRLGILPPTIGTDLAFSYDFPDSEQEDANEIVFILRDWIYDNNAYLNHWHNIAKQLRSVGKKIRIVSFDLEADREYLRRFSDFDQSIWNPRVDANLSTYINSLRRAKVIVSSRAHGVVVAAGLGIPSISIEIEPKLKTIANMIPGSTLLIPPMPDIEQTIGSILKTFNDVPDRYLIDKDVERNRETLSQAVKQVENYLTTLKLHP